MSNPKFTVEFTVKGATEFGSATIINSATFEALNAAAAHDQFKSHAAALELEVSVVDITEHENFLEEMEELAQEVQEKLENIKYQFDQMYKGQKYIDELQYQALKEWFENNLESLDVDL